MSPRLKKIVFWGGYPAFYLVCFVLFAYLSFPFEHLRDRVIVEFENEQRKSGGNAHLEIDSLSSYWFSGVDARGVRYVSQSPPNPDGTRRPPTEIEAERITARVGILPLLIGRMTVHINAKAMGGSVEATVGKKGEERSVEANLEDVAVNRVAPLADLPFPMNGDLNARISLTIPDGKLPKANGSIQLTIKEISLFDGKTKLKDMVALPKMNVGDLSLECDIKDGTARVTKLGASGQDLDLSADGKINLKDPFTDSQADLYARFKFSDSYKNRNEDTRSLFGAPGSTAPALLEIAEPRMKTSKRADGFYSWHVWGMLKNPSFGPAPTGTGSPSTSSQGSSPGGGTLRGGFGK